MEELNLARVLVVHDEIASRLTLQTILRAGGYAVDVAASSTEALTKMDDFEYDLILSSGVQGCGGRVLAYARVKDYRPATAMITSTGVPETLRNPRPQRIAIHTENIPTLLTKVADLIGARASRRSERALRQPAGAA